MSQLDDGLDDEVWIGRFVTELLHFWSDLSPSQGTAVGRVMLRDPEFRLLSPEEAAQHLVFDA